VDSWPAHPATNDPADAVSAWAADGVRNRWFFDALLRGAYPADVEARFEPILPDIRDGDLATIATPLDFLGVNNCSRTLVRANGEPEGLVVRAPDAPLTTMGWEIYPDGMRELLCRLHVEYDSPPIYVTESGAAFDDVRTHDGRLHDIDRIAYLNPYIGAVEEAMRCGVDVRGYFVWSLLDNFEWAERYSKRFGLVFVDYPTLERVPKDSYEWLRALIARLRSSAQPVALDSR
jgi:beta-glucosidase